MNQKVNIAVVVAVISLGLGLGTGYLLFHRPAGDNQEQPAGSTAEAVGETIYTCSMHPQIRQNEPGLCPICEMDLIPVDDASSGGDPLVLEMTPEAVKLVDVQTTVIGRTAARTRVLQLNGRVEADERRVTSQVAHVPGRIEQLYVTFTGETVRKGQKLARLYSPELITAQRELLEAVKLGEANLLEATRRKLRFWKIPEVTIQEIEASGEIRETVDVEAEATGIVTQRRVSVGDYVREGSVLFDLADLSQVWVLFDAYEEDLAHVSVGDEVEFRVPSLPGRTFTTRITYIDPVINPQTRVASLRAEVVNPGGRLKPEMLVRGTLRSPLSAEIKLSVPKSAVLWTGTRSVVYVKVPGTEIPSFEYREVILGESLGKAYIVTEGLEPGEEVVTYGAFAIDAAAQLNNQQSMMNRRVHLQEDDQTPNFRDETPAVFRDLLAQLTESYVAIKDGFVATDAAAASTAARNFITILNSIDMYLLQGAAHRYWMNKEQAMKAHAGRIAQSEDVEEQRKQFEFLSNLMIETVKAFGAGDRAVYVQHCPMAFDNQGADWLSYEDQIRNPYFGDKMLKCGIIKDSITNVLTGLSEMPQKEGNGAHDH